MTTRYLRKCTLVCDTRKGYLMSHIGNSFRTKTKNQQAKSIFETTKQRKELVTTILRQSLDFIFILSKNRTTKLEKTNSREAYLNIKVTDISFSQFEFFILLYHSNELLPKNRILASKKQLFLKEIIAKNSELSRTDKTQMYPLLPDYVKKCKTIQPFQMKQKDIFSTTSEFHSWK